MLSKGETVSSQNHSPASFFDDTSSLGNAVRNDHDGYAKQMEWRWEAAAGPGEEDPFQNDLKYLFINKEPRVNI